MLYCLGCCKRPWCSDETSNSAQSMAAHNTTLLFWSCCNARLYIRTSLWADSSVSRCPFLLVSRGSGSGHALIGLPGRLASLPVLDGLGCTAFGCIHQISMKPLVSLAGPGRGEHTFQGVGLSGCWISTWQGIAAACCQQLLWLQT